MLQVRRGGTFGILIPIVINVFGFDSGEITIIAISACMAGAVCGDHCSPISDTTIMASAGAQCNHLVHVSTQLPYALFVAGISFVGYIVAGFVRNVYISLYCILCAVGAGAFGYTCCYKSQKNRKLKINETGRYLTALFFCVKILNCKKNFSEDRFYVGTFQMA